MAEFEDVLTNQPVVIDNVRRQSIPPKGQRLSKLLIIVCRDLELSRQVLLAKIIPNVSSRLCASLRLEPQLHARYLSAYYAIVRVFSSVVFVICSVGRPKHIRVMAGALEGDTFIGRKAQEFRGLLKIKYPMEHGIVTDWDDMERIWSWVYAEELGTLSEEVRQLHVCVGCASVNVTS